MILFAIKCSRDPRSLEETISTNSVSMASNNQRSSRSSRWRRLAVYANIMADATAMDEDEMFNKI